MRVVGTIVICLTFLALGYVSIRYGDWRSR